MLADVAEELTVEMGAELKTEVAADMAEELPKYFAAEDFLIIFNP